MKAVDLLINSMLPEPLRDPARRWDKRGLDGVMAEVAKRYPSKYATIVQEISDAGRKAAYLQGETLTLADLKPVVDKDAIFAQMDAELDAVDQAGGDEGSRSAAKQKIWGKYADNLEKLTTQGAAASGNRLGGTVASGARGNAFQLKAMLTTPALYTDYKDRVIPMFVRRSFGEGLRPAEFLASTFGVRKSTIATKSATAKAGDLLKQLMAATAREVVTDDDCGGSNGLSYPTDDGDIEGRVTARDYPGIPAGSVLDRESLTKLRSRGLKTIMARSPLTCQAKSGICSHCLGQLPNGRFASRGYMAGITAGQALGEVAAQSSLSTKHKGGGFQGGKKTFSGFEVINQLLQSPEVFPDRASVAEVAGRVQRIEDAPQGGKYVTVGDQQHYVLPGYDLAVKPGDEVEAGDQLSDGIVDVSDVVRLRGLGEGRKYLADRLGQAYQESGYGRPNRANLELVARSALDHVRVDDPEGLGDYLPDDLASYNRLSATYEPATDARMVAPRDAGKQYLQSPALHFTVGTQLTPKMVKTLEDAEVAQVAVSASEPKFRPEMVRLRAASHNTNDWLARLSSNYLGSGLADSAERSRDTQLDENPHFAPRLMQGKDFGKQVAQTGKF